jgi:hypothetical protein
LDVFDALVGLEFSAENVGDLVVEFLDGIGSPEA